MANRSTAVFTSDRVSDLTGLSPVEGQQCQTLGYYNPTDGGGNLYKYEAASSAACDGGFILDGPGGDNSLAATQASYPGTGTGRFVAVDQTVANAKQFGAKGDGVSDDTFRLNAAISAGVDVDLLDGDYQHSGALDVGAIVSGIGTKLGGATSVSRKTISIPSDYPTLQAALDVLGNDRGRHYYTLNIESGHALTYGFYLNGGDYSNFEITSDDATVPLDAGFDGINPVPAELIGAADHTLFAGVNCTMPVLSASIDMANVKFDGGTTGGDGVYLVNSDMRITEDNGVINASRNGIRLWNGCKVSASNSNWSGANATGARMQHGCIVAFDRAHFDNCQQDLTVTPSQEGSAVYVSKGCVASLLEATITNSGRNGLEVRRSWVHAEGVDASGAAGDPGQFPKGCVVASAGSHVECRASNLSGSTGGSGIHATAGSKVIADASDIHSNALSNVHVRTGSEVLVYASRVYGAGTTDFDLESSVEVDASECRTTNSPTQTSGTLVNSNPLTGKGDYYTIATYVAGDDFTNVGAGANATGERFRATGSTPTVWANGSTLVRHIPDPDDFTNEPGVAFESFNIINHTGLVRSSQHLAEGWLEFTPVLVDQSGNDVSDNGGSYLDQVGLYRRISSRFMEIHCQVYCTIGGNVVTGEAIQLPESAIGYLYSPPVGYLPAATYNSGLSLASGANLIATMQGNGTWRFRRAGTGSNTELKWGTHTTGTFGITFGGVVKIRA